MPKKLLEGIKVADFSWFAAGPLATSPLAEYGAEVIKIEAKSHPDTTRIGGPLKDSIPGLERGGWFLVFSTNKLSMSLNLAHPRGLEIAKRLIARADIVVENFAGGVMKRLGLGYEELKKVKPDIIMLSACLQGQTGPHTNISGTGAVLAALTGFYHIAGWPDREPVSLGIYTDFVVPHFGASILLAALLYRHRTGQGQYIDLSQYEAGLQFMAPLILDYTVNRRVANRMGNRSSYAAPHNAYRCHGEDRWCAIAVFTDEEWQSFGKVIGNPALAKEPKFSTLRQRKENEDELDRLVEEWTINYSPEEVMSVMQAAGVGAGVLLTDEDLLEHDPQLKHRHYFWELDHPVVGKHYVHRNAFVLSKMPTTEVGRAPLMGEHNEYALKEFLGMSDEEVAELVIEGVIE